MKLPLGFLHGDNDDDGVVFFVFVCYLFVISNTKEILVLRFMMVMVMLIFLWEGEVS